jgi:SAM-dependent methyltransferase
MKSSPSVLYRNGYARLGDLESPDLQAISRELENYQATFVAKTRSLWQPSLPFTADGLYTWSRQWEYAYALANLPDGAGRFLDAGSGITFFPFFLAERGREVSCCDLDPALVRAFQEAVSLTGVTVDFKAAGIDALPYGDSSFDVVSCVSVLEHTSPSIQERATQEFYRVLKPGGRLILTCDVSLTGDGEIRYEDFAVLLSTLLEVFEGLHHLDLHRPTDLLTTDYFRVHAPWRLPWRSKGARRLVGRLLGRQDFRHVAVFGLTLLKAQSQG